MKRFMLVLLGLTILVPACDRSRGDSSKPATHNATTSAVTRSVGGVDERTEPQAVAPEDLVVQKPLLWAVTAKGGEKSYLIGTYHVGTDFTGLDGLPTSVRQAFTEAQVVVLEADEGVVDPSLNELILLEGPRWLDAMLTPEQWDVLLEESGLPPQELKKLRPHTVSGVLARKWTPNAGVRGMDGRFRILAKAYEKKLTFLETPREQLELVADAVTIEMLQETLDNVQREEERTRQLLAHFRAGDVEALSAALFPPGQVEEHDEFYEAVFWRRNAKWVDTLAPLLDEGGAFVAVGAGHLLGARSIPELLKGRGYSVRRVEP